MPDGPDPASGRKWKARSVLGDWASHSKTLDQIMDTNGGLEWTGRHGHDQVGHTGTFEYDPDPDLLALASVAHGSKFSNACRRSGILDQGSISTTR